MTEAGRKLVSAARDGKLRDCKELMKLLPSLDFSEPPYWRTALWHAACRGHEAVTRFLLDRGASVNHQDVRGSTALHEAAAHGQQQIAELLIERGARVDLPDSAGDTPLFLAVYARRIEIVALLLSKGAQTNRVNNAGLTCYHLAAAAGSPELSAFLLHRGAYTNRFDGQEHKKCRDALRRAQEHEEAAVSQKSPLNATADEARGSATLIPSGNASPVVVASLAEEEPGSQELSGHHTEKEPSQNSDDTEGKVTDPSGNSPQLSVRSSEPESRPSELDE